MASISFIDFVFPLFQPQSWQSGISIFHAGGVLNFQRFGEMVSARVRAGIGETFDVRIKLHSQGKCVQWMECTCQANRRRGEKCAHLASFCLYLDQDKASILERMNMSAGTSDRYLLGALADKSVADALNAFSSSGTGVDETGSAVGGRSAHAAGASGFLTSGADQARPEFTVAESVIQSQVSNILSATLDDSEPCLLVAVNLDGKRQLTYRLGVDDASRVLENPAVAEKLPKKFAAVINHGLTARRFFDVKRNGKLGLKIMRCVGIYDATGAEKKTFALDDVSGPSVGRIACYVKKMGFVPFEDNFSPSQIVRWEEYPKTALLDGDMAASLFQSAFGRLRETAELRLAKDLSKIKVFDALEIPELKLKSSGDGYVYVEPSFRGLSLTSLTETDPSDSNRVEHDSALQSTLLAILKARAEGRQYLTTKNGWVKLSDDLDWLQGKMSPDGKLKLSTLEFIKFREQFAAKSEITGNGEFVERLRTGLVSLNDVKVPSIESTGLKLRSYQEEGVRWLWWLYTNNLGGLLADEMGLGKTHQAMALLAIIAKREAHKLSLVICPTSVIDHWLDKMAQYIPDTRVICYHGAGRRQESLKSPKEHIVIVTSYGILLRDINFLMQCPWDIVVLDEAHLVKNQTTRTYRAACRLASRMRLCLTGTPLENDLMELKNLFDFIAPNYLGSDAEFKRKYFNPTIKDRMGELELQRLIHPFKMRRNKRDVLKDLPEKVEDVRHCQLKKEQHELYAEALALKGRPLLDALQADNGPIPYVHVFSVISMLKQICDDPFLIDPRYESMGSGKLDLFDELLKEALESDQKVVVFSQYAKMVNRISSRLTAQGVKHVYLTGSTIHRGAVVREFQENNDVKVFVGSLLAGGTGIDLTAGSVVIHYDRWWNAAKENQATDRIHRIGQNRNVQVYKLVTKGTLEERIDEIINRKRLIFDRFVEEDTELFKHLSREDLLKLLAPPESFNQIEAEEKEESGLDGLIDDGVVESFQL